MWLKDWLVEKLNPAQPTIARMEGSKSVPEPRTHSVISSYKNIEIINRAVQLIINACNEIPFIIEGPNEYKKINRMLNIKPNPWEDRSQLFRRAYLDFMLYGNAFFYYDKSDLYLLPAENIKVHPHEKKFISHYEHEVIGSYGKTKVKTRFEADEIIHVFHENEGSIFVGRSPIRSCIRLITLYNYMVDFQSKFFKNNAVPGLILTTENALSDRVKTRLLANWEKSYNNLLQGSRSPAILDNGLKISDYSNLNFSQLDFESSIERIQQDMAKALGVPYVLLKSGNDANIEANQRLFYLQTIIPILEQFCSAFQHFFNLRESVRPDRLAVPCLQPDNKTQATYYATLVNSGIITPNEAREGLRFDNLPDLDKIREPQNITGSAVNPSLGGRPPKDDADKKGKGKNDKKDKENE